MQPACSINPGASAEARPVRGSPGPFWLPVRIAVGARPRGATRGARRATRARACASAPSRAVAVCRVCRLPFGRRPPPPPPLAAASVAASRFVRRAVWRRAPPGAERAGAGPERARAASACKQTAVPPARSKVTHSWRQVARLRSDRQWSWESTVQRAASLSCPLSGAGEPHLCP